jgi:hypothetical protein
VQASTGESKRYGECDCYDIPIRNGDKIARPEVPSKQNNRDTRQTPLEDAESESLHGREIWLIDTSVITDVTNPKVRERNLREEK